MQTLVADIYKLLTVPHEPTPALLQGFVERIADAVTRVLREDRTDEGHYQSRRLVFSNIGTPLRKLWFILHNPNNDPTNPTPKDSLKFLYGTILEELLIYLMKEAGYEVTDEQKRVTYVTPKIGLNGRIDCRVNGKLVDIKSASNAAFRKYKSGEILSGTPEGDPFGVTYQILGYMNAEGETEAYVLCINKSDGELVLLHKDKLDLLDLDLNEKLQEIADIASQKEPPKEKCYEPVRKGKSENYVLAENCKYCPFKFSCWENLELYRYSWGIEMYTQIDPEERFQPRGEKITKEEYRKETHG